jgi:hypothetical protein
VSQTASAACAEHAEPSIGPCERCGTFVCGRCGKQHDGDHLRCHRCGPPPPERPPGSTIVGLVLAAMGMMCPPLSLVGIAMGLSYSLGAGSKRSPLGAQYARWAVMMGLMSAILWGVAGWLVFEASRRAQGLIPRP